MMNNEYEVVIIGGGPAGSAAAIYLQNSGLNTCIIEKKIFPREVLCGEFISAEVVNQLKGLGLYNKFLELNPNPINTFRLINSSGRNISTSLDFEAFGLSRGVFDEFILSEARASGASILQPAEIKSVFREDHHSLLKIHYGEKEFLISTTILIAAYGRQNILDKQLKRSFTGYQSRLNGIKFHVDNTLLNYHIKNEIQIYTADGIYCGINSVNDNLVTMCFLEDHKKSPETAREKLIYLAKKNRAFNEIISGEFKRSVNSIPIYGTGNIFFGKREKVVDGIFMVGDAAGVIAPVAGDGISMAFESSKILAGLLSDFRLNKMGMAEVQENYTTEWNRQFRKRLHVSALVQKVLLNGKLGTLGLMPINIMPSVLNYLVKATRT